MSSIDRVRGPRVFFFRMRNLEPGAIQKKRRRQANPATGARKGPVSCGVEIKSLWRKWDTSYSTHYPKPIIGNEHSDNGPVITGCG